MITDEVKTSANYRFADRWICPVFVCAAFVGVTVSNGIGEPAQPTGASIPAIVQRAEAVYTGNVRGLIGMQRHFSTRLSAGPIHHSEESTSGLLLRDGAYVKIKYYSIADDGRSFSQTQIDKRNEQTNKDWANGEVFFKEPYDPRFAADYRFKEPANCSACPSGVVSVSFSSGLRDVQHGSGSMWIDGTTARVIRLTYTPNALPPHATSGAVTEIGGEVLDKAWYVTRLEQTYGGHAFLFKGTGTFVGTVDDFKRFPTTADGLTALDDRTI